MSDVLAELEEARRAGIPVTCVTVAATKGSVPRAAGTKMLVRADGHTVGTVGGGKFEALVVAGALAALAGEEPLLRTYPLHEADADSFGAICGGEVTVLLEPFRAGPSLVLVGAGHCARAIAGLAAHCRFRVIVLDDRPEMLRPEFFSAPVQTDVRPAPEFIAGQPWTARDALVLVSRNFEIDREALDAALARADEIGYVGMIGCRRKVDRVFADLAARGRSGFGRVFAPIGLDIGADSPTEIAVSIVAEILAVLRGKSGAHLSARHRGEEG